MKCYKDKIHSLFEAPSPGPGSDWSMVTMKASDWPKTEGSPGISRGSQVEAPCESESLETGERSAVFINDSKQLILAAQASAGPAIAINETLIVALSQN